MHFETGDSYSPSIGSNDDTQNQDDLNFGESLMVSLTGNPYPPRTAKRKYLFIDGEYFQKAIAKLSESVGFDEPIPIDYPSVAREFDRVIYYDALPVERPNQGRTQYDTEFEKKRDFLNGLRRNPGFHVRDGVTRVRSNRGRSHIEQKGVDTWLAIDVLQYAFRGIIDTAEIITGDLDLYPLFEALVQTNTRGVLHYQEGHTSDELIMAADEAKRLTPFKLLDWADQKFQVEYQTYTNGFHSIYDAEEIGHFKTNWGSCSIRRDRNKGLWQASFENVGNILVAKKRLLLMELIREFTSDRSLPDALMPND